MPEALADSGKTRTAAIRCLMSRRLAGLLARRGSPDTEQPWVWLRRDPSAEHSRPGTGRRRPVRRRRAGLARGERVTEPGPLLVAENAGAGRDRDGAGYVSRRLLQRDVRIEIWRRGDGGPASGPRRVDESVRRGASPEASGVGGERRRTSAAVTRNLRAALGAALLSFRPGHFFDERELFAAIANLSYGGDVRFALRAEDPRKVGTSSRAAWAASGRSTGRTCKSRSPPAR